jgi:hypothetical protein
MVSGFSTSALPLVKIRSIKKGSDPMDATENTIASMMNKKYKAILDLYADRYLKSLAYFFIVLKFGQISAK